SALFVMTAAVSGTYHLLANTGDYYLITGTDLGSYAVSVSDVALDDHSDLRDSGTALAVGASAAGQFDLRHDDDWFSVSLTQGTRYYFTMADGGATPAQSRQLTLYDTTGQLVTFDYTYDTPAQSGQPEEPGGSARFVMTAAQSGTYHLLANTGDSFSITGTDTGGYTVNVAQVALDDHSDLRETGTALGVGATVAGQFDLRQDNDWFRLDLAAGTRYYVTMSGSGATPVQARELNLFDASGALVKFDYSFEMPSVPGFPSLGGGPARFVFTAEAGTYYLLANNDESYALAGTDTGTYSVNLAQVALDDHSDLRATGTALAVGGSVAGQFDLRHDDDWFRVDLTAGSRYYFTMSDSGATPVDSRYLSLFDANGELVKLDFTFDTPSYPGFPSIGGGPARFVMTAAQSGTYYLLANALGTGGFAAAETGGYAVGVTQVALDDHSDLRASGTALAVGATLNGQFDRRHDDDWFRVELTAGTRYHVTMVDNGGDPVEARYMSLFDANGELLKFDFKYDVPGQFGLPESPGGSAQFVMTAAYTGTHYLLANDGESWAITGSDSGGYKVSLAQVPLDDHSDLRDSGTVLIGAANVVSGGAGSDVLNDTSGGASALRGFAGNDTLTGGAGDDTVDGGTGTDVAVFGVARSAATITAQSVQAPLAATVSAGALGTDTLAGVERIAFSDVYVALDVLPTGDIENSITKGDGGIAGKAYRLYQAAFARTPDQEGLGYWISQLDAGETLFNVATGFLGSDEFKTAYGANPSNETYVQALYQNVLGRDPDQAGYDYWNSVLNPGYTTRQQMLVDFSESGENKAALMDVIGNGFDYIPWG
ncbi:MAG TPA: DUF4214 domain-containing protein, partial [Quisquiliibacterium sp.]|nr:DUF4214 domain-containing protein [Quisquiliibacterium sp.]